MGIAPDWAADRTVIEHDGELANAGENHGPAGLYCSAFPASSVRAGRYVGTGLGEDGTARAAHAC